MGYSPVEIGDFVLDFDFKKLNPDISVENVLLNYGINNGERFEFILKSFAFNKLGVKDISFKNLFKVTNKNLLIIGTNFSKCCEEVFSWETTPDMSVITAVRISCSIPVFFTPVLYNGSYYVDGGVKNNFPINYCNKKTTLGLYIKNNNSIEQIESIVTIVTGCLGIVADTITCKDTEYHENVIQIDNYANEMIKFDLTIENKLKIINLGQIYAKKFIGELPNKICSSILNDIINNIQIESENNSKKIKYHDQSTQTDLQDHDKSTQ
jgi:predicted acylesterase/phospholipase RssA